jgi:hemerythrin
MTELKWNDSYLIGNREVDAEHKHLFEIAHKALVVVEPSKRKAKIKEMVQELYMYTKTHFSNEEAFMRSIGYPYLKEHVKIHKHVIGLMNEFILKLPQMSMVEFEKELAFFVQTLIVHHIVTEDKKITTWLKEQKNRGKTNTADQTATTNTSAVNEEEIHDLDDI